jgi:hypothetical protein
MHPCSDAQTTQALLSSFVAMISVGIVPSAVEPAVGTSTQTGLQASHFWGGHMIEQLNLGTARQSKQIPHWALFLTAAAMQDALLQSVEMAMVHPPTFIAPHLSEHGDDAPFPPPPPTPSTVEVFLQTALSATLVPG